MKTIRRMISSIIITVMLLSTFACSGGEAEVFDYSLDYGDDSSELDFGGQSMLILTGWDEEWKPESGFTAMGDHLIARYKEIETKSPTIPVRKKTEDI